MKPTLPFAASAAVLTAALGTAPADAQSLCGAREAVVEMLGARYGETVRSIGLAGGSRFVGGKDLNDSVASGQADTAHGLTVAGA